MARTAIQLHTLREMDASLPEIIARVGETDFDGVEFAGLGDADPDEVARALDDADLDVAGAHVPFEDLEANPESVAEAYRELDCDSLVVPYLDESHFESEDAAVGTARRLDELGARVANRGAALGYHNHDHEFVDANDRTGFDVFVDESGVNVELDVGWVVAAGRDPTALLDRLAGRAPLVHLKDTADGTPVELGEGDVDVGACADAARRAGAEWLVYEHDDPADPEESLEHGADLLSNYRE